MAGELEPEEALAQLVLTQTEPVTAVADHLDENVLGLIELDALDEPELTAVRQHLVQCALCRQATSRLLLEADRPGQASAAPVHPVAERTRIQMAVAVCLLWLYSRRMRVGLALAAAACLAIGMIIPLVPRISETDRQIALASQDLRGGDAARAIEKVRPLLSKSSLTEPQLAKAKEIAEGSFRALMLENLTEGQFDAVEILAREAEAFGVRSARTASLESQAIRKMPGPLALAFAGRLDSFGLRLQAPLVKSIPEEDLVAPRVFELLTNALSEGAPDREASLNRAHSLLTNDPTEAGNLFQQWLDTNSNDLEALLGKGLASYLTADYQESAAAFEAILQTDPGRLDVRVNYALALESSGKRTEAVEQWRRAGDETSDTDLRAKIEIRLRILGIIPDSAETER